MKYKKVIFDMKCHSFSLANTKSIPVHNIEKIQIGKLVPVGDWILEDKNKVELISTWRQKTMRMFLTQFESSYESTLKYLKNLAIAQESRILFLIYDATEKLIGHIGIAEVDGNRGELDNLMRGQEGGDSRLIFFAEIALLNWSFKNLGIKHSEVLVLSYNWMAISLHEEVGFTFVSNSRLKKYEKDAVIFHKAVTEEDSNVNYSITKMLLKKDLFYLKTNFL
jgi:RimJ/RimL family protein N-acetyltransferase